MSTNERIDSILSQTGLDFEIKKIPMVGIHEGQEFSSPYYGLQNSKTDEILYTVKEGYRPTQNRKIVTEVLKGLEPFGDQVSMKTGASLNGGKKVYLQIEVKGQAKVGNDEIRRFITFLNSNDGSARASIGIGDITMSCQNQFYQFKKSAQFTFSHTAGGVERLDTIPDLITSALDYSMRQIELYKAFQSTEISRTLAYELIHKLQGVDLLGDKEDISSRKLNTCNDMLSCIQMETNEKGQNLWGLHSGITRFTTHNLTAPKRENGKLESLLIGSGYKMNQDSLLFAQKQMELVS